MPRHAAGNVAADPADMDEHRQPDLLARYSHRLVTHTYQRHFETGRLTAAFNTVQWTVKEHRIRQRCIKLGDRGRDGVVSATPPSEPDGRISRVRLTSQWGLGETNHKRKSHVPD